MPEITSTVENLIQIKEFSQNAILVTKNSDCSRVVSHVTIMEAPDLHEWVTGGEFVLTTWHCFSSSSILAEESFRKLAPKIAAIGIKTHRFIEEIPENILRIAEEFKLPVFEIKRETLFRNLVNIIANQIQNCQLNMLTEADSFYKELIEASAHSDDIGKILNLLSSKTHYSCLLMNSDLRVVDSRGKLVKGDELESVREYLSNYMLDASDYIIETIVANIAVFPCYIRNKIVGFILLPSVVLTSERYKLFCQQVTTFLASRLWSIYEDAQRSKYEFLNEFGQDGEMSYEYVAAKMSKYGIDVSKNTFICSIYVEDFKDNIYLYLDIHVENKVLVAQKNKILLICNSGNPMDKINNLLKLLQDKQRKHLIVLSNTTSDLSQLRNFYRLATKAVDTCQKMGLWGLVSISDIEFHIALYDATSSPLYKLIKNNAVIPLNEYDKGNNSELLKTLYIYLRFNSLNQTAKFMNIHINTLRYRLDKIYDITGKNIAVSNDYHELFLAMVIADLEGLTKSEWNLNLFAKIKFEKIYNKRC